MSAEDCIRLLNADKANLRRTLRKVYHRVSLARFAEYPGPQLWESLDLIKEALEWSRVRRTKSRNIYPARSVGRK